MLQSRVQSSPCLQRGNSSRALGCWTPGSRTARNVVVRMNKVLHGEHGHGDHTVKWFEKHKVCRRAFGSKLAATVAPHTTRSSSLSTRGWFAGRDSQ